jgi:hypothetical protein
VGAMHVQVTGIGEGLEEEEEQGAGGGRVLPDAVWRGHGGQEAMDGRCIVRRISGAAAKSDVASEIRKESPPGEFCDDNMRQLLAGGGEAFLEETVQEVWPPPARSCRLRLDETLDETNNKVSYKVSSLLAREGLSDAAFHGAHAQGFAAERCLSPLSSLRDACGFCAPDTMQQRESPGAGGGVRAAHLVEGLEYAPNPGACEGGVFCSLCHGAGVLSWEDVQRGVGEVLEGWDQDEVGECAGAEAAREGEDGGEMRAGGGRGGGGTEMQLQGLLQRAMARLRQLQQNEMVLRRQVEELTHGLVQRDEELAQGVLERTLNSRDKKTQTSACSPTLSITMEPDTLPLPQGRGHVSICKDLDLSCKACCSGRHISISKALDLAMESSQRGGQAGWQGEGEGGVWGEGAVGGDARDVRNVREASVRPLPAPPAGGGGGGAERASDMDEAAGRRAAQQAQALSQDHQSCGPQPQPQSCGPQAREARDAGDRAVGLCEDHVGDAPSKPLKHVHRDPEVQTVDPEVEGAASAGGGGRGGETSKVEDPKGEAAPPEPPAHEPSLTALQVP